MKTFQLHSITHDDKEVLLSAEPSGPNNTFTFVVGRNAAGKSRLLRHIVSSYIFSDNEKGFNALATVHGSSTYPESIIAVSTGRNDKFPKSLYRSFQRKDSSNLPYVYIGNDYKSNEYFSIAKSCLQIIKKTTVENLEFDRLVPVFNHLDLKPSITITLKLNYSVRRSYKEIQESFGEKIKLPSEKVLFNTRDFFTNYTKVEKYEAEKEHHTQLSKMIEKKAKENGHPNPEDIVNSLFYLLESFKSINSFSIDYNFDSIKRSLNNLETIFHITQLVDARILTVSDILFRKKGSKERYRFSQASSGEQNILMMMLGIASTIKNGSMICIDEPEISLHPRWQLEIVKNLESVFSCYLGCHFLIATHSPQVVSGAPEKNSFVVNLDTNEFYDANAGNKKSSDYQLAEIFEFPGNSNEYLVRILLVILSKISNGVSLESKDKQKIMEIRELCDKGRIEPNDPVSHLSRQIMTLGGLA